jgi:hypothetical protein
MSENQSGNGKLDSWKEIAAYLGRDVRTVIRWEKKRNLPVHRLPGGQAVFAYKSELDDWLKQGAKGTAPLATMSEATPPPQPLQPPPTIESEIPGTERRSLGRYTAVVGTVGVFLAILAGMIFWQHRSASASGALVASVTFTHSSVQALDDAGRVIWAHQFPKRIHPEAIKHVDEMNKLVHIADLYGDGHREVLVAVPLEQSANPSEMSLTEIDCFSDGGKLLWSYLPTEKFQFGSYEIEPPWIVEDIFVSKSAKPTIWAALAHYRWGDSFVAELNPETGKAVVRFVNTGIVYKLNETPIGGKPYLLIGGFNNEYAAGMLAALDESQPYAVSPQTAGTRHKCLSCPEGVPSYYFVFRRSEINRLHNAWEDSVRFINVQGNDIEVDKAELGDPALGNDTDVGKVHVVYEFHAEPTLRPVAFRFDSWYDMMHRDLQNKGKLDHAIESCPERLHPEPVRVWTPAQGWQEASVKAPD